MQELRSSLEKQEYFTFSQAARLIGVSRQYIYKLVKEDKLRTSRLSWKTQARLTLAAKTVLTPENYFNLTPKSSGRRGHFYFGLFVFAGFDLADTSSGKHDFMSGVNQTVKDRVSYRRFSDCLEPIIHRQL